MIEFIAGLGLGLWGGTILSAAVIMWMKRQGYGIQTPPKATLDRPRTFLTQEEKEQIRIEVEAGRDPFPLVPRGGRQEAEKDTDPGDDRRRRE